MVNQTLLTIFVALTTVAVIIQTGILAGFFYITTKLNRRADTALDKTHNVLSFFVNRSASNR
jgi:hypothetical protein